MCARKSPSNFFFTIGKTALVVEAVYVYPSTLLVVARGVQALGGAGKGVIVSNDLA